MRTYSHIRGEKTYGHNGRILLLLLLFAALPMLSAQAQSNGFQDIGAAIKSGNAKALSAYFDNSIEVTVLEKEGAYSKSQAEAVLKDFFSKNRPKSFQIMHKGSSGGNSQYAIGKMETADGSYRTYIYVKKKGDDYLIQEIRFERK